jgi:hypothetical protein
MRTEPGIPAPRLSPEAGVPAPRTSPEAAASAPDASPEVGVSAPEAGVSALEASPEGGPWSQPTEKVVVDPKPGGHRSAPNPRFPVGRSLVGALTVVGAVAGLDFGAAAIFGDHGAGNPADPSANPSALSSPQAAAPAAAPPPAPQALPVPPPLPVPLPAPPAPSVERPRPPAVAAAASCVAPAGMTSLIDQDPTDEQVPWRRSGNGKVPVYFAVGGMAAEWRKDMEYGAAQWNKSPCVDTKVVTSCPSGVNCVTVSVVGKGDDGNFDAVEKGGFTTGGHIDLLNTLTTNQRKNVAVHEMGHAIGLKHRKAAKVLMNGDTYDDVFNPDATEYKNLLFAYGKQLGGNASTRALRGNQ